ncbi:hypothetical protein C9374_004333 [Naegleria lovaniensis]|uniref:Uncharacterized protein n=1 Tax=Naegleria lovaniensis TaxID=51637 RepID=A0AA88GSQ5_NAELO|nr:uncharacterized protein C9374_004333 [Naegleria lovaniensis]KAG2383662.1 hypothetical protein C9374_004333 [Naegleria lovaniensis]
MQRGGSDVDPSIHMKNVNQPSYTMEGGKESHLGSRDEEFDAMVKDDNYNVENYHLNHQGDYTIIFRHKQGGQRHMFTNIPPQKVEHSRIKDRVAGVAYGGSGHQ